MADEKLTLGVIFGGDSPEYEVSCVSAASVMEQLDPYRYELVKIGIRKDGRWWMYTGDTQSVRNVDWETDTAQLVPAVLSPCPAHHGLILLNKAEKTYEIKKLDCVFPVLHGRNGEDGVMQGLLELSGVPYIGCKTRSAAVTMDKAVTKMILEKYGIKQTEWMLFYKKEYLGDPEAALRFCQEKLSYPVFVKPANAGSSKGISKVCNQEELKVAFDTAYLYDEKVLVEKAVAGREIEIGLLEKDGEILTSCCGEIRTKAAFYDYNAKYHDDSVELVIPADIDPVIQNTIAKIAKKIFRALDCEGFSRADFFLSGNHILFNEINAIPGFTSVSMYPKMFEKSGISYAELIDTMVNRACKK